MRTVYYKDLKEKQKLKNEAHKLKERTLHDSFIDKNGNETNGESGQLVFDENPVLDNNLAIRKALRLKLKSGKITQSELIEYLQIIDL